MYGQSETGGAALAFDTELESYNGAEAVKAVKTYSAQFSGSDTAGYTVVDEETYRAIALYAARHCMQKNDTVRRILTEGLEKEIGEISSL